MCLWWFRLKFLLWFWYFSLRWYNDRNCIMYFICLQYAQKQIITLTIINCYGDLTSFKIYKKYGIVAVFNLTKMLSFNLWLVPGEKYSQSFLEFYLKKQCHYVLCWTSTSITYFLKHVVYSVWSVMWIIINKSKYVAEHFWYVTCLNIYSNRIFFYCFPCFNHKVIIFLKYNYFFKCLHRYISF